MLKIRFSIVLVLILIAGSLANAQNNSFSLDVLPKITIPVRDSAGLYSIGGGGDLTAKYDFNFPLYIQGGISYNLIPTLANENLNIISATAGIGLKLNLGQFIMYRLGLNGGAYLVMYDGLSAGNPVLTGETGFQFNFSPSIQASLMTSYNYYMGDLQLSPSFSEQSLLDGLSISVGVSINPGNFKTSRERRALMKIQDPSFNLIFPVFYQYYSENPLGKVIIENKEKRTISDVKVSFFVQQYMEAPKLSAKIDQMESGEEQEIDLYGLFKNTILEITEATTVSGEIIVEYMENDEYMKTTISTPVKILNRNNMTWDDNNKAAAFVTAKDPTVLRFSRNVSSYIRNEGTNAVNENLRNAMAIFQALHLFGMEYAVDPDSSYLELSKDKIYLDFLQFPQQTLDYRSGDCDDLSILYASLLESIGIRTAFITIPGHIYVAFALNIDEREAKRTFSDSSNLIYIDEEAWVPVEVTLIKSDFLEAWSKGSAEWRANEPNGNAALYKVRKAWTKYPPTGFSSELADINVPQTTEVIPNYLEVLNKFITRQIGPIVSDLEQRIQASHNNIRLVNRLGTVYARYGLYDKAQEQYKRILSTKEYVPALINMGNIAYLEKDINKAKEYYYRALKVKEDDPNILINIARINFDLEKFTIAAAKYREAEVLDPDLAHQFNYIINENSSVARASSSEDHRNALWDEE